MKRYPSEYEGADSAPGRCVELLRRRDPRPGLLLDLGCGRAPIAELVRGLELTYVGVDVDDAALQEVAGRGYETHRLDLGGRRDELLGALRTIVDGRPLSGVLTIDLLEHLVHPEELLGALRALVGEDGGVPLIVSIPNVTHVDVAAKLLLGRWDLTDWGLLDDTHLRFFSERLAVDLLAATGWRQVDAADVVSPESDQLFPADAPPLRPGSPARELLRRLRSGSEPHGDTYQFVRRFEAAEASAEPYSWAVPREPAESGPFASVIVAASDSEQATARLLADLRAQSSDDFETLRLSPRGAATAADQAGMRIVEAGPDGQAWNAGIAAARGRYLCFLDDSVRVAPDWIEGFREAAGTAAGRVLKAETVLVPAQRLGGETEPARNFEAGTPQTVNSLDLLSHEPPGRTILPAYAVPAEAARSSGVRFEPAAGDAAAAVFLTRASELCGVAETGAATVAVAEGSEDGEATLDALARSLDEKPLILPAGSATRLIDLRRALIETQSSLSWRVTRPLRSAKRLLRRDED